MNAVACSHASQEIELKLALLTSDASSLATRLAQLPVLARRKPTHQHLQNVYYDTPEQILRQGRIALRIRRVDSEAKPQWLQTLKTGGTSDSALSQRGEWETPVPSATLAWDVLKATPWSGIDPDGSVFRALAPVFVTSYERTRWVVRRRDGSVIEVALDLGHIAAGEKRTPLCELELELLAGPSAALFDLAQRIAHSVAVLPLSTSKAERGYALAGDGLDTPISAQSPQLKDGLSLPAVAGRVLSEMFCQFTANLNVLRTADDPEVVHQARVGWRRFRGALRLFKPALAVDAVPSWEALQSLLRSLGELRDLDVARIDTLTPLADAYTTGDPRRTQAWQGMTQALLRAAKLQRKSVRNALHEPAVGAALLEVTRWLHELSALHGPVDGQGEVKVSLRRWSKRRMARLHRQLTSARKDADRPDTQHRVRILAKRMRYGIDALRTYLPKRRAKRWVRQAARLQQSLGAARDVMQAAALVERFEADRGLAEFLRGVCVGQTRPK